MKKRFGLVVLLCLAALGSGCSGSLKQKTATVELQGNPTTGYTWIYAMSSEGVVREIASEYIADRTGVVGSGGKFIFTFEALTTGEAELVFSYLRVWESDTPAAETVAYRATVDDTNNLSLTQK
jgi:inhibitor of cysteine peptidase